MRIGCQRIVFRGRDLLQVGLLLPALVSHYRVGGKVAESLALLGGEGRDAAHQVGQRQHIDQPQQVADGDLRKLQAQSLGVDDPQAEQPLADGLAAPAPFEDHAVGQREKEVERHRERRGPVPADGAERLADLAEQIAARGDCREIHGPGQGAGSGRGQLIGEDHAFRRLDGKRPHSRPASQRKAVRAASSHTPKPIFNA